MRAVRNRTAAQWDTLNLAEIELELARCIRIISIDHVGAGKFSSTRCYYVKRPERVPCILRKEAVVFKK
jgi:hypothetical protein